MKHTSEIQLSKSALKNNIKFFKNICGKNTTISSVVKANAYWHSIETYTPLAEKLWINHFATFSYQEAIRVQNSTKNANIMIMWRVDNEYIKETISKGIEFYIFELEKLKHTIKIAKKLRQKAKIHIEIETWLNRTWFEKKDIPVLINLLIKNKKYINFVWLCTHLAGSESTTNYIRIKNQIKKFNTIYKKFQISWLNPTYRHVANSAGTIMFPKLKMNMVRIWIAQYGFWPSKETKILYNRNTNNNSLWLKRILTRYSKIMSIKNINTGDYIGYGTSYIADKKMRIAVIPTWYSHGFSRNLSNKWKVLINWDKCEIVGLVWMNEMMANISSLKDVKIGDKVTLIGEENKKEISVSSFSDESDQLNYEFLSQLPNEIKHTVVK